MLWASALMLLGVVDPFAAGNCTKIFIDGGSNVGESVDAFYRGTFHRCSLNQPNRLYPRSWHNASASEKGRRMLPLRAPAEFCVRSFEANPKLMPRLAAREAELRASGRAVRTNGYPRLGIE